MNFIFQRTLWVLPHAGGPFLEGINSCDYYGRSHFPLTIPDSAVKMGLTLDQVKASKECKMEEEIKVESSHTEESPPKIEIDKASNDSQTQIDGNSLTVSSEKIEVDNECDSVNGIEGNCDKMLTSPSKEVVESSKTATCEAEEVFDVMKNDLQVELGDNEGHDHQMELENHKSSEGSESVLSTNSKESATTNSTTECSSVDKDLVATGLGLIPGQYLRPEHVSQFEKLSFNLIPRVACDSGTLSNLSPVASLNELSTPKVESQLTPLSNSCGPSNSSTPLTSLTPILQNSLVSHNMSHQELLAKLHQTAEATPIPAG